MPRKRTRKTGILEKFLQNEIASSLMGILEEHGLATFKDIKAVIEEVRGLRKQIAGVVSSKSGKILVKKNRAGRKPQHETCTLSGCYNRHYAKGLCASHYQKHRREIQEGGAKTKVKTTRKRGRKKSA